MSPTWECRLCNVGGSGGVDAFERHYVEHQRAEAVAARADSDKSRYDVRATSGPESAETDPGLAPPKLLSQPEGRASNHATRASQKGDTRSIPASSSSSRRRSSR